MNRQVRQSVKRVSALGNEESSQRYPDEQPALARAGRYHEVDEATRRIDCEETNPARKRSSAMSGELCIATFGRFPLDVEHLCIAS